jgi:hypothetical protein
LVPFPSCTPVSVPQCVVKSTLPRLDKASRSLALPVFLAVLALPLGELRDDSTAMDPD